MKLLVPTDFSKNARRAIDYAVAIADKTNAEIVLLHAYQIIDTETPYRKLLFEEYNYSNARKLHDELNVQRNRIAIINPLIKVTAELSDNTPKQSIIEACAGIDFIVMGTQGATDFTRIFMGSVTASVIGNAQVPVLAVPRSFKWKVPATILLATNNFEHSPEILHPLFKLAEIFDTTLHIVIFYDVNSVDEIELQQQRKSLGVYRKDLGKYRQKIKITSTHLGGIHFENTLQQYIDENSIDLLAMITYKRNFLENIFHRSATKKMAYRTRVPLLALPAST